ncbi:hypothetical protein GQ457_02G003780 [Hibiscus cannabinus]
MENLVSSWCQNKPVPESYIFPPETRPGKLINVPSCKTIPVIDLGKAEGQDRTDIVQQILNAGEELLIMGFQKMCWIKAWKSSSRCLLRSNDKLKSVEHRVLTNSRVARTTAAFFIAPTDDCVVEPAKSLVGNASLYRAFEFKEFLLHYFKNMGNNQHTFKRWKSLFQVGTKTNLCLNLTYSHQKQDPARQPYCSHLQNHSGDRSRNDKLKSVEHRVVTNSNLARTSAAFFIAPSGDSIIEPAKSLVGRASLYRAFEFKDFLLHYFPNLENNGVVMERFRSQA